MTRLDFGASFNQTKNVEEEEWTNRSRRKIIFRKRFG